MGTFINVILRRFKTRNVHPRIGNNLSKRFSGRNNYQIYLGLGLSNEGGNVNTDDFIEPIEEGNGYSKQLFICGL